MARAFKEAAMRLFPTLVCVTALTAACSQKPADPPSEDFIMRNAMDSQEIAVGWWPGDQRYGNAAYYAYAHPAPPGFDSATLAPPAARWDANLGEYVLDHEDAASRAVALEFARSALTHACDVCGWDPELAASAHGSPPPIR